MDRATGPVYLLQQCKLILLVSYCSSCPPSPKNFQKYSKIFMSFCQQYIHNGSIRLEKCFANIHFPSHNFELFYCGKSWDDLLRYRQQNMVLPFFLRTRQPVKKDQSIDTSQFSPTKKQDFSSSMTFKGLQVLEIKEDHGKKLSSKKNFFDLFFPKCGQKQHQKCIFGFQNLIGILIILKRMHAIVLILEIVSVLSLRI